MTEFTLTLKGKDYAKYGLLGNPFPFSGVPDEHPNVYIGQDDVLEKINYKNLELITRTMYEIGYQVANRKARIVVDNPFSKWENNPFRQQ